MWRCKVRKCKEEEKAAINCIFAKDFLECENRSVSSNAMQVIVSITVAQTNK